MQVEASLSVRTEEAMQRLPKRAFATPSLIVCVLVAASVTALWPTAPAVMRVWSTMAEYRHGALIVAISALWLLRLRMRIDACEVRATPLALAALAAAIVLWMIAYRGNSELMQQMLLPAIMQLAVLAALGPRVFATVFVPLNYLYFAIPLWEQLVPFLQWLTTSVAERVLGLMNVPTAVEGNHVTIPAGHFTIAEGCSGKRYLIVGLAFAIAAGAIQGVRAGRLVFLAGLAAALALVINWVRVVIIIYAGHVSDMRHYLVATEHLSLGYALFAPLLISIVLAARRLARGQLDIPTEHIRSIGRISAVGWIAPLALLATPMVVSAISPSPGDSAPVLGQLPIMAGVWQGPLPPNPGWRPQFSGQADERRAAYSAGPFAIEVYVNGYGVQSQGRELVFHKNSVAPAVYWSLILKLPGSQGAPAMIIAEDMTRQRWVIAHTYTVGGRLTSSPALAQFYYGAHAIWRTAPAGVIAFAAPCTPDCQAAAVRLSDFWRDYGGEFVKLIPRTL